MTTVIKLSRKLGFLERLALLSFLLLNMSISISRIWSKDDLYCPTSRFPFNSSGQSEQYHNSQLVMKIYYKNSLHWQICRKTFINEDLRSGLGLNLPGSHKGHISSSGCQSVSQSVTFVFITFIFFFPANTKDNARQQCVSEVEDKCRNSLQMRVKFC